MKNIKNTYLASLVVLLTPLSASADLIGARIIEISSALPSWLQISEVVATQSGTGNDVALSSAGASAAGTGVWSASSVPANAIDGIGPAGFPSMYHSDGAGADELLTITLGASYSLSSVTVMGRGDGQCCSERDFWNIRILNADFREIFSGTLDARNADHQATVRFDAAPVPEPGTLALLGLGLVGIGLARRKKA